jgi:hypothetical protein
MKTTAIFLVLAASIVTAGQAQVVMVHPFVTDRDAAIDTSLEGVWGDENRRDEIATIRLDGATYSITYWLGSAPIRFRSRLLRTGGAGILDLVSASRRNFALPAHLPIRIWVEGNTLHFAMLDSAWLKERAMHHLAFENVNGTLVVTSPGEAVTRFLVAHGSDARALGSIDTLVRVP